MKVEPSRSYHAKPVGRTRLVMPDGKSQFKIYYFDIVGRDEPERFEWSRSRLTPAAFEERARAAGWEGIGFVTAFPHLTKLFRFAPSAEILMHVRAFDTASFRPLELSREEGWMEFACYAEAAVAADEYAAWASQPTVAGYLETWSGFSDGPIRACDKLRRFWDAEKSKNHGLT